jgi:hypothetical protein
MKPEGAKAEAPAIKVATEARVNFILNLFVLEFVLWIGMVRYDQFVTP